MRALLLGMLFLGTLLVGSPVIEAAVIASNVPQMPTGASEDFYTYTQFAVGFDVGDTNQTLTSITLPMELGPASAADYTGSLLSNLSVGTINEPGSLVTNLVTSSGSSLVFTPASPIVLSANQTYWFALEPATASAASSGGGSWSGYWTWDATSATWVWTWIWYNGSTWTTPPAGAQLGSWDLGSSEPGTMIEPVSFESNYDGTTWGPWVAAGGIPGLTVEAVAVPEPTACALLIGAGVLSLSTARRRRSV